MTRTDVLVIGGGLAGLSTAWHLRRLGLTSVLVVEKEARPGGRAGTVEKDGFLFDQTGHLLHLHDPYGRKLILRLLAGNLSLRERSSWIHSHGVFTRYPFQANTFGLPRGVVEDCVALFAKSRYRPARLGKAPSFERWCLAAFGEGISRHFMFPYNAKLWQYPLDRLTNEWCGPFVPQPKPEDVIQGAYGRSRTGIGYNPVFNYPRRGGIGALADALAAKTDGLRLGLEVESVDLKDRTALIRHFGPVHFRRLINTAPLNEFIAMAKGAPDKVRAAAAKLRHNTVYVLNLGARGVKSRMHWGYFPEARFPFYRAGIASNFSAALAPAGHATFYIEIAAGAEGLDLARAETAALRGLRDCGLIKDDRQIVERLWLKIPCAYVIYDRDRAAALPIIFDWLKAHRTASIGRYGAWKYSFMEESVKEGLEAAEDILKW